MSNRIDKIFNKKLVDHVMPPSQNAWARVEANLEKKNKGIIWFRWAAALLIPVLIGGTILWLRTNNDNTTNAISKIEKHPMVTEKNLSEKVIPAPIATDKIAPTTIVTEKVDQEKTEEPVPLQNNGRVAETILPSINEDTIHLSNPIAAIKTPEPLIAQQKAPALKAIVIEYTLESIEPSAPVKTEKAMTVTMELKEKKKLQKVIDFARGAKNSEGPFATIRQAKEDLFAFNFKKDKTKKQ